MNGNTETDFEHAIESRTLASDRSRERQWCTVSSCRRHAGKIDPYAREFGAASSRKGVRGSKMAQTGLSPVGARGSMSCRWDNWFDPRTVSA